MRRRPRAVEYSDWYARRLTIHRYASYTMLPLFAAEYALGDKVIARREGRGTVGQGTVTAHQALAGGIAALFGLNTLTGAWNLYDSRHDPAGRTRRIVHTALLLAADAGFVATGVIAENASEGPASDARTHRTVALASMGVATVGAGMMLVFR